MADVVTGPTILQQNDNRVVIKIVNQSDGTGGTTVFGDVSAMDAREDGTAVAHLGLLRVWYSCQGGDGGDSYARLDEEDSDGDGNFTSLEYMDGVGTGSGTGGTVTGSFTVPATLADGTYRLRIVCDYYAYEASYSTTQSGGCGGIGTLSGVTGYGEVEDYSLTLAAPPSCGTPSNLTADVSSYSNFDSTVLSWSAGDSNDNYTWAVYSGTDTTATPIASSSTTSTTASVSGLTTNTFYTATLSLSLIHI